MPLTTKLIAAAFGLLKRRRARPSQTPAGEEPGLTRRGFLAGAAAVGATGAISAAAQTASATTEAASAGGASRPKQASAASTTLLRQYDVIVVGAGLAG